MYRLRADRPRVGAAAAGYSAFGHARPQPRRRLKDARPRARAALARPVPIAPTSDGRNVTTMPFTPDPRDFYPAVFARTSCS